MDIYVLDNELTRVRTVATSSECLSATEELELGKAGQLTLSLPISYKDTVKEMNILAIHDRDDRYRLYIVTNRNLNNYTLDIVAISYPNYALSRVGNVKDLRPKNRPLTELIPQILGNSGWTLNHVDENLPGYTGSFYYLSQLECLSQISEALACEFDFYVTIAKNVITGQFVDVVEMLGEDTNKRFEYGTNALEVVAEYDATEVYTQAVGRGKGEETGDGYGRRIEFTDVVWSKANGDPVDKPAGQNWVNDPYENYQLPGNKRPQKIIEFEEITDPNVLLEETYKWLLDNNHPKVQFKAKIVETGALNLGDRVQIIRPDLDIRYKTRVFKLTRNLLNENLTEVEFGDNIATTPMDKLNSITTQVNSTNQALQRVEEQITMIDADGNRITYGPDEPPVKKKGDMWYKTTPDGKTEMYIWNGETWELTIGDAIFDDLEKKVNDAMSDAEQAKVDANTARHNALNALEKANDANDATLQIYNNLSDLEDGLNTKFLQTDELIAMQANKIGIFYPDSGFQCGDVNKYYVDYSTNGTVQYAKLNKVGEVYRLWLQGKGVPTNQNYGVKLKDLIAVDSSKELRFNFNYRLYWSSSSTEGIAEVVVTEYTNSGGSFSVVKDNVITVSAQEKLRWYSSTNTFQLQSQTTHIRVLYRNRNISGDRFESSYTSVYLSNGTDNLSSMVSVANDNINLSVQKGDVINQINVSPEGILIDGNKIHITGATSIDNAAIQDAAIANLSASKLTAGTIDARTIKVINLDVNSLTGNKAQFIQAAFNSANSSTTINSQGILTKNDHMTTALNAGCLEFRDKNGELSGAFETKDWLLANGLDDTILLKILGDRQFTIGFAYDRDNPDDVREVVSFKRREDRNWMYIKDDSFRIVSRDGYRLRPGSSMNYENNKIYPSLTNDNESVGILLGDKDLIFRDGYRDNAGSNQMSLNRIRSGQLDSLKTPTGGFTWTIKDGTINGNASLVLSGSATSNSNFIGMNNADIWLNASQSVYITDRSGSRYKLEDLRWGRMGQLELPDGSYKMKVISKTINGNNGIALSGTDGENFIALNNADIWLKAKYNIVFSDGNGNGITLDSLRAGRTGQLQTVSKKYKISIADSSINGNPALALSGTNKDNYIAINNADIYLKAKYNIYFDDGYGSGFTLNQLRQKVERSASTLIADNGEIRLDSARVKGKQAKILADGEGACIAFADGTLMFRDLETDDWHTLSELLNNKGA